MAHVGFVEPGESGADIGDVDPAFIKDQRCSRYIPVLRSAAARHGIELAGGDLDEAIGERGEIRTAGIGQAGGLHFLVHGASGRDNRGRTGAAGAAHRLAIDPGPAFINRIIHFIAHGGINDASHRHAVFHHRERHGPAVFAAQKTARAIDGIHHKNPLATKTRGIVHSLFAQPAIIGPCTEQGGGEVSIHQDIGLADGGGIFLVPAFDGPTEEAAGNDPGRHRRGAEQFEIVAVRGGRCWHLGPFRPGTLREQEPAESDRMRGGNVTVNGGAAGLVNRALPGARHR